MKVMEMLKIKRVFLDFDINLEQAINFRLVVVRLLASPPISDAPMSIASPSLYTRNGAVHFTVLFSSAPVNEWDSSANTPQVTTQLWRYAPRIRPSTQNLVCYFLPTLSIFFPTILLGFFSAFLNLHLELYFLPIVRVCHHIVALFMHSHFDGGNHLLFCTLCQDCIQLYYIIFG